MKRIDYAILATLIYADIFDYPLTRVQLWRFLIESTSTWSIFNTTLESLLKKRQVLEVDNLFSLPKRKKIIPLRKEREKIAISKLRYAKKIARLLKFFPTIQLIGISGALAMHNAPKDDDLDFFIITSPGTVWLTRCVMTFFLDIFHLRRKPGAGKWQNKICLNMFMDEKTLRLPSSDHNLYIAHEVVQLLPLVNKHKIYERFLYENRWTKKFLPNAFVTTRNLFNNFQQNMFLKLLTPVETMLREIQIYYMHKRRTSERLTKTMIRFHPKDIKQWVLEEYKKRTFKLIHS